MVGDKGRHADPEIDIRALGNVLRDAPGDLVPSEFGVAHAAAWPDIPRVTPPVGARLARRGTFTTRVTKIPGVTMHSGSSAPTSPLPALLLTMIRSLAPCAIRASISSSGTPAPPNPPTRIVEPSRTSASAASTEGMILSIMLVPNPREQRGYRVCRRKAARAPRIVRVECA